MSLLGMPWRVALALQADGWILRSEIIQSLPQPLDESSDRPQRSHEHWFLLAKSKRYYYDLESIREPVNPRWSSKNALSMRNYSHAEGVRKERLVSYAEAKGPNRRTVWNGSRVASIERCILAGSQPWDTVLDPFTDGTVQRAALRLGRNWIGCAAAAKQEQGMRPRLTTENIDPLYVGDTRDGLRLFAKHGMQARTCVTSPPYYGLRDYGTAEWEGGKKDCKHEGKELRRAAGNFSNGGQEARGGDCRKCGAKRIDRQIGLERSPEAYVANLVEVFRLVREVLTDDGTVWLNLGDTYSGQGGYWPDAPSNKAGSMQSSHGHALHGIRGGSGLPDKNLLGIPWRVAFALQQPYYLGKIKLERDRAWLAALTDGEGCISILETTNGRSDSYPPVLQVRMCDLECIERAALITGHGNDKTPAQTPPSQGGVRPSYQWRLHGRTAADTIAEIYPFLLIKRKQAIVAWNHQAARETYETKRGVPRPCEATEKQMFCLDLMRRLNAHKAVDIPSWMIEPPKMFGPGWYLRSDVIWSKPNPMPESITDRPTKSHEYVFLLSKSPRYYFDAESIKERSHTGPVKQNGKERKPVKGVETGDPHFATRGGLHKAKGGWFRNKRTVWTVNAEQEQGLNHFAIMPRALVSPCILAGSAVGDYVLDPFMGSGTVARVAEHLGRKWLATELNPEYADIIRGRVKPKNFHEAQLWRHSAQGEVQEWT